MPQWHCNVAGHQYGPVELEVLQQWAREQRLGPNDYVWTEGMPQWAPAGTVPGLFAAMPGAAPPLPGGQAPVVSGTGGRTPATDLIGQAWELMKGRWGIAIGGALLFLLLIVAASGAPYIGVVISLIVTGPFMLGYVTFFLTYERMGPADVGMLFHGFRNFGTALAAYLLVALLVYAWMLGAGVVGGVLGLILALTVDPTLGAIVAIVAGGIPALVMGAVAQLRYSQTFYLLADNPSLGPLQAITRSKEIMRGHKLRLFWLHLLLGLLSLLGMLACCVGYIFVLPLVAVTQARFYDDLHPPAAESAQSSATPPA